MSEDDREGAAPAPMRDVVFVGGPNDRGDGMRVIRKREESLEVGEIRPVEDGKPLHGDMVRLKPRAEHERLFDVETVMARSEAQDLAAGHGPAQVASDRYRAGWDAIFGERPPDGVLN
jgi:hypothetical protein